MSIFDKDEANDLHNQLERVSSEELMLAAALRGFNAVESNFKTYMIDRAERENFFKLYQRAASLHHIAAKERRELLRKIHRDRMVS